MKRRQLLVILIGGILSFPAFASPHFELSPTIRQAYEKVTSLQFEEAAVLIENLKVEDPENLLVHHVENYIDFFKIFIGEDKGEFERSEKNKAYRLNEIKKGNQDSPFYLYTQAEIQLQWALTRLKFEELFSAFKEINAAYDLLELNQQKFPDFIPNKKSLGIIHALIGTVPDNYKWAVKLMGGMEGTIKQGQQEIEEVLDYAKTNDFIFEEEALVMYSFLMLHLNNNSKEAWAFIQSSQLDPKENPLICFVQANVAMRTGRNDDAIRILEERPTGDQFFPFHYLDYLLGVTKLSRGDQDANIYIQKYVDNFQGLHYIKEAYLRLAWYHLFQNDENAYQENIGKCITEGQAINDGDKSALKTATSGVVPHKTLLEARILFDGGYYKRATTVLDKMTPADLAIKSLNLECTYRKGRIADELNQEDKALTYYLETIEQGKNEVDYFACNAALKIGQIYEQQKVYYLSEKYYLTCLELKPNQYRNGIHQQAKAGLLRLKKTNQ